MELKEGMYCRTKQFGIQKIKWFDNEEPILENGFTALQSSGYKSSYNIIDLIEVGDLVKYEISGDIYISEVQTHPEFEKVKLHIEFVDTIINIEDLKILSIVTKEQFKQMEYEVK